MNQSFRLLSKILRVAACITLIQRTVSDEAIPENDENEFRE